MLTEQTTANLAPDQQTGSGRKKLTNQEGLKASRTLGSICERTVTDVWAKRVNLGTTSERTLEQLRETTQKTVLFLNSFHERHPEIKEKAAELEEKKRGERLNSRTRFALNRRHDVFAAPYQALAQLTIDSEGFVDTINSNEDWSSLIKIFEIVFPEGTRGHRLIDEYHSTLSKHRQGLTPDEIYYPAEAILATARSIDHLDDFLGLQFMAYVATCIPGTNIPLAQFDGLSLSQPIAPTKRGTFDFWGLLRSDIDYYFVDLKTIFRKAYVRSKDTISGLLTRERKQSRKQLERILLTYDEYNPGRMPNLPKAIKYYYLRGSQPWKVHERKTPEILTDLKEQTAQDLDNRNFSNEERERRELLIAIINELT